MATTANPMFSSLVPGMNPSGNLLSLLPNTGTGGGTPGANPLLGSTNLSTNVAGRTNPYDVVPATGSFTANTGGYPSTGPGLLPTTPGATTVGGWGNLNQKDLHRLYNNLKDTYGAGLGAAIMDFLSSGAGYNQQAINNLLASLQPGIQRGEEDLMSQFSVEGNRFGSGAQIGLGDYLSRVNLNEGELVSQMYEQAVSNYMNVLMGTSGDVSKAKASSPSIMDKILSGLGIAGTAASGLSAAGVGAGGGTLGTILTILGGFAGV